MVAASATVALLRDYPGATVLTIAGAASAALVGYLRVAADQHYLVDVLAGSALGTLVGVAIPLLLHRRLQGPAHAGALRPAPGGVAVVF